MTLLDDGLRRALRSEADDAAASVDLVSAWDRLEAGIEASRRARTRTRWLVGTAAAAAFVLAVGALVALRSTQRALPEPVGPSPSARHWTAPASILGRPSFDAPGWTTALEPVVSPRRVVRWQQDSCRTGCPTGKDRSLTVLVPQSVWSSADGGTVSLLGDSRPYSGYAARLEALRGTEGVTMTPWTIRQTAQELPATTVSITTSRDLDGVLGCDQLADAAQGCRGLAAGTRTALAVVDAGHTPLVVWTTQRADGDGQAQDAELRALVGTLRLSGLPVSCTDQTPEKYAVTWCLSDLWQRIEADAWLASGGARLTDADVERVWAGYHDQLGQPGGYPYGWSYALGPGFDEASSNDYSARWTFSGRSTTGYLCLGGPHVTIFPTPC